MKICKFIYNGFYGSCTPDEDAGFTAEFIEWTPDPGIAKCKCSDDKERLIPTFAMVDTDYRTFPTQPKTGVLFGTPSSSSKE